MQLSITVVRDTHLCDLLSFGDPVAFIDQDLSVVPVSTQILIIMFDDDKPPIADQSTPAVNDFSALGGTDRI